MCVCVKYSSSSAINSYQPIMEFSLERETDKISDVAWKISRIEAWRRGVLHCMLSIASDWARYLHADYFVLYVHIILIPPSSPYQTEKLCSLRLIWIKNSPQLTNIWGCKNSCLLANFSCPFLISNPTTAYISMQCYFDLKNLFKNWGVFLVSQFQNWGILKDSVKNTWIQFIYMDKIS